MEHFYIGSCTEFVLQGQRFERLGDKATFKDEAEADIVIRGGGQFITAEEAKDCGFTPEELRKYAYLGPRQSAPPAFHAKVAKAQEIFRTRCNRLRQEQAEFEAAESVKSQAAPEPAPAEEVHEQHAD